ncbi:uncharacterized protein LOC119376647 [Rhipicephalus sanguineus]|uniref:uncharacterized protein LOC119376647 n=1 Tax=Rhipicephalus sanguineus TaxID=34632 RepID=UPI001894E84C|nr:uncharacterized protein LOC119376647 [Rhipicephalus sanguineus]
MATAEAINAMTAKLQESLQCFIASQELQTSAAVEQQQQPEPQSAPANSSKKRAKGKAKRGKRTPLPPPESAAANAAPPTTRTERTKVPAASATRSDSLPAPISHEHAKASAASGTNREESQQLEKQAVNVIGGWLKEKAKEATTSVPPPSQPAPAIAAATATSTNAEEATAPASDGAEERAVCPPSETAEEEQMDCTATRKRSREASSEDGPAGPSKQVVTDASPPLTPVNTTDDTSVVLATASQETAACTLAAASPSHPEQRRKHQRKSKQGQQPRNSTAATAEAATAPRPPSIVVDRPHPRPSSPPAGDDFKVVMSKAASRRARAMETAAINIDAAVVGTVLFRPSTPGGTFRGTPRLTLAAGLAGRPGVAAVRVNHLRNVVAADATTPECLAGLLSISELHDIPVTAREPADRRSCLGFVYGVDGDLADSELIGAIASSAPVTAATREGRSVKLRFASAVPPAQISIYGLQLRVRHVKPRPMQCRQCGRFGHVAAACQRAGDCIRCGRKHPPAESCKPHCINCGGAHAADTPSCPRWQEERRVATLLATSTTPLSRRAVRAAVREESREVRSYAAALKRCPPRSPSKDLGQQRTPTAPRRPPQPAVTSAAVDHLPAASPITPAEDPRDAFIANLMATLQAVIQYLPEEHPLRATCLQAIGAQPGAPRSE